MKTTTVHSIIGGEITLYRYALDSEPTIIERGAKVPTADGRVWIHDWEIVGDKVRLRYSMSSDMYAPILDGEFPLYAIDQPAQKPCGKGWEWQYGRWRRHGGTETREAL